MDDIQALALLAVVLVPTLLGFWAGWMTGKSEWRDEERERALARKAREGSAK